jgi:hypothetical protein
MRADQSENQGAKPPEGFGNDLGSVVARLGVYAWFEARLFEIIGGWIQSTPELEVKLLLGVEAPKHAWHAELFESLISEVPGFTAAEMIGASNVAFANVVAEIGSPKGADQTIEKLVGLYRVAIPRLIGTYESDLAAVSPISNGPLIRVLKLVLRDLNESQTSGEDGIVSLLTREAHSVRAAARKQIVEQHWTESGGPVPLRAHV